MRWLVAVMAAVCAWAAVEGITVISLKQVGRGQYAPAPVGGNHE